ncbi:MAG: type II toxin-antitoxin system RelE/ParE family toxin [Synergistaceae bacterium]|nr:type II toxin-antitoxin system RelE/ParE family toxin [Synergistaceae bacterium]
MAWRIELSYKAEEVLEKMGKTEQKRFDKFFTRLATFENPRLMGKALTGPLGVYWSYRVGDYRAICDIHDNILTIEVIRIGHRKEVYKN